MSDQAICIYLFLFLKPASPQLMNMLGNSYPTSGGSLSQNQIQAGNNSLSSMGMLHDASDTAPFDINDFPRLTGRPSSAGGPQGQYGKSSGNLQYSILGFG
jgi:CCR4-NOT transcription complex subunit 2